IQILAISTNLKWVPWYDYEALFGMMILLLNPIVLVVLLTLLSVNFAFKDLRLSGILVLISLANDIALILIAQSIRWNQLTPILAAIVYNAIFLIPIGIDIFLIAKIITRPYKNNAILKA
ncbi:MAG TPA: hypothetical protein VN441_01475, partial [Syntrophomonas sp.]|nr:hypothetical protein [Syntrophomonas sp.]